MRIDRLKLIFICYHKALLYSLIWPLCILLGHHALIAINIMVCKYWLVLTCSQLVVERRGVIVVVFIRNCLWKGWCVYKRHLLALKIIQSLFGLTIWHHLSVKDIDCSSTLSLYLDLVHFAWTLRLMDKMSGVHSIYFDVGFPFDRLLHIRCFLSLETIIFVAWSRLNENASQGSFISSSNSILIGIIHIRRVHMLLHDRVLITDLSLVNLRYLLLVVVALLLFQTIILDLSHSLRMH